MTEDTYLVPDLKAGEFHRTELIIKKSRFITSIAHTKGVEECKNFISAVSSEFSDARHNCFAYNGSKPGESGYAGCSDDGEPHGTAGHPMLNVLLHSEVGELTAVVTRYFGGILLGTGGLVKAYQDSVKQCLDSLKTTPMVLTVKMKVSLNPKFVGSFMRMLGEYGGGIEEQGFDTSYFFIVSLPESSEEAFCVRLNDLTAGTAEILKPN